MERRSYPNGIVSLETYEYHVLTEDGTNICRFDGPHLYGGANGFADVDEEDHSHHAHTHVHLYDLTVSDGQKIYRTWPGETPTLFGLLKNVHDWRYGQTERIAGHKMRVWPF